MNDIREKIQKIVAPMDGWLSFHEGSFLYDTALKHASRGAIVEIGSWKGKSTIWLAHGVRDGKGDVVHAIDPHTGAPEHQEIFKTKNIWTFEEFQKNIKTAGIEKFVYPIVNHSENAAKNWRKPVAFLWIDGAHAYEAAKLDFDSWFPHLIEGGMIAYHDSTYDDVRKVMRECVFFSRNFNQIGVVDSITFATKIAPSRQLFRDRLRNLYVYLLSAFYGLRRVPLPRSIRNSLKTIFKKIVHALQ